MRSSLNLVAFAAFLCLVSLAGHVSAQTDAETALQNARVAFGNEQFEAARDLLETASQTDADNPDIFLLLGKAHYQLGEIDAAIKAWNRTLQLAPAHAYAKRMVAAVKGRTLDADVRIQIARSLLAEQQAVLAFGEIAAIKRMVLSQSQLAQLLSVEAEVLVEMEQPGPALKALSELAFRDPDQASTAHTRLLTGKAKLALGGQSAAAGLAILTEVKTEFADTADGIAADLALISFRVEQGEDGIDELAAWITANGQHPDLHRARHAMIHAVSVFLKEASRQPKPTKGDALSETEVSALAAAQHALASLKEAELSFKLSQQIVSHIQTRWFATRSYSVANAALQRFLDLDIQPSSRHLFENALAQSENAAASEQLDEVLLALREGEGSADALVNWIGAHGKHPRVIEARRTLVTEYLKQRRRQKASDRDADLVETDTSALAAAGDVLDALPSTGEKSKMIAELLEHLKKHYADRGANSAVIAGLQSILEMQLPLQSRHTVLTSLATAQAAVALSRLESEVAAGTLKDGPLPADLVALQKTFATINESFPGQPAWSTQASVGERIAGLSGRIEWPATVTKIKMTDAWALEFVLPVIVANPDPKLTPAATNVVNSIVECAVAVTQKSARGLATRTHQKLLDLLAEDHALWPATVIRQLNLRVADDAIVFQENVSEGRGHLNATLSDNHKSTFALASSLIGRHPNSAAGVLTELEPLLRRRSDSGYQTVVEEAYAILEENLPPTQLRDVRLAVAKSWVDQVIAKHARLLNSGFQPPKELDEQLRKALVRCYQLQSDLEPSHEFVNTVQRVRATVVIHYRNLQYHEAAAEAIGVTADPRVDWLDANADFELAALRVSIAMDELAAQTKRFEGRENLTLTPAINEAIAGLEQFIADRPTSPLVGRAVTSILAVGKQFETYEKFDISAEIYTRLETFATENEALTHAPPNTATVAQRAAHAVAIAMHVKASKALDEALSTQPEGAEPAAELSDEFRAAIAAYQAIITKYPDGPLVSSAIGKMMEIALQHANVGAWDVADGVYAILQNQELPLRQPERLEFARALCEMGKVIPEHSQQVLTAITLWGHGAEATADDMSMIAGVLSRQPVVGDFAVAGIGGGGAGGFGIAMEESVESPDSTPNAQAALAARAPRPAEVPATSEIADPFGGVPAGTPAAAEMFRANQARAARETDLLAAVRRQQSALATQVAMLRDKEIQHVDRQDRGQSLVQQVQQGQQAAQQLAGIVAPVLSDAEIARRQTILDRAYTKLQAIRNAYADSTTAAQAREQILVIVNHWRSIKQWQRSAALVKQFLADNPADIELPPLRHEIARDYLAWAAGALEPDKPKQELLDEVNRRFTLAREELSSIIAAFPDHQSLKHQAQWDIANSHLSQARVVAGFSSTLARGQFVRAANELLETADLYHDHPKISELPNMLWNIAQELTSRRFFDEAITVWNEMTLHYPGNPLAEQAALKIAQTYQNQLRLPLRAVESYLELNFSRGGNEAALQEAIFQIATQLTNEKRWVESLHVLETFVDSFPAHASAGQALTMIGQVHQTNEVWEDAIAAYRRVILEYDQGTWALQSKWSIAECTINLSRWEEAQGAYREYQKAYPEDPKVAEATSRLETLKDLARFQKVVDEVGQRKAFDAQYQIASIVRSALANPVKAIIEYRKVALGWPDSHLADDALFQVGMIYMELGQTENARDAFFATAEEYPNSPLADDALFQVGASFESEAQALAGVTRGEAVKIANDIAQKQAYTLSQGNRREQRLKTMDNIAQLKRAGKGAEADKQTAFQAALNVAFDQANASVVANWAAQQEEALTTAQLADRQDKTNAALRKAVTSFRRAASVTSADKADDALLRMAQIYDQRLKDSDAAMSTWLEIVKQYSGTTVAEDASWKIAQYYETHEKYGDAISAYNSFLRNYRRSPKASNAQAAIAENHEQLGNWVEAMDAYTNYINNYPEGTMAAKAKEQIAWIKTYRL